MKKADVCLDITFEYHFCKNILYKRIVTKFFYRLLETVIKCLFSYFRFKCE